MELLDLQSHDPEEYEGKVIVCNGCEYVVGSHLGAGAERTVHKLINRRSLLCLHVIKFWHDQELAGRAVQLHQKQISLLRRDQQLRGAIPVSLYFQGHGGFFELQRFVGPPEEVHDAVSNYIDEGDKLRTGGDYAKAVPFYQYAAGAKPFHTLALHNLAVCHAALNNYQEAFRIAERVVQIEPNDILYQNGYITFAANSGAVRLSMHLFERMKSLFPYVPDLDDLGITIYLACGEPQRAERLLAQGALSDGEIKELQEPVRTALAAKARALSLMQQARALILSEQFDDANACRLLGEAYKLYDKEPFLAINLGLSLMRAGDLQSSIDFLLSVANTVPQTYIKFCYANVAFCLIKASKYDAAMTTLEATMSMLLMLHGGQEPEELSELPGVTIWVDEESAIEEHIETAAQLIEQGMARCQRKESVTEPVVRLAILYRMAAAS